MTRTTGALHEDPHTFFYHISMNYLRMRNVSDKSCRENQNTHCMCSLTFFFSKIAPFMTKHIKIL